ncbi:MAG: hypothetical protein V2A73_02180 [Pseudomonadota bacterium]
MARPILQDLALVLCVAAVTTVVFRRLRQPVVLGYLLTSWATWSRSAPSWRDRW